MQVQRETTKPEPQPAGDAPPTDKPETAEPVPQDDLSKKVEALTGAHTRVVWSHHLGKGTSDTFANGSSHQLHGFDSRDGRGVRVLLEAKDNYSRPLLSPDGAQILFTRKKVERDAKDLKHYEMEIYLTDWTGKQPQRLRTGHAVHWWRDSADGTTWIYALEGFPPTHKTSWPAERLLRFRLETPEQTETVWDRTLISPDNIQFSRDGRRASGQTPWPHGGRFVFEMAETAFRQTTTGCWAAMAPDNSYVSWMLDGSHKRVTMHAPGSPERRWILPFNKVEGLEKGEIYHPRWSNHPRIITITGPYLPMQDNETGSVVSKGGRTAEVILLKLNPELTEVESKVVLTQNETADIYPDVWIAQGEDVILEKFTQASDGKIALTEWPLPNLSAIYLFRHQGGSNVTPARLDGSVSPEGTALFGRAREMRLESGLFSPQIAAQKAVVQALQTEEPDAYSVEFILHPPASSAATSQPGTILTLPGLKIEINTNGWLVNDHPLPVQALPLPAHVTLTIQKERTDLWLNGELLAFFEGKRAELPGAAFQFGGTPGAQVGISHVALYPQLLMPVEIQQHADYAQQQVFPSLPEPTPRLRLRTTLTAVSTTPTSKGIEPYTRALVSYVYRVDEVLEGEFEAPEILIQHWAMMDGKLCSGFPRMPGQSFECIVEAAEAHPELEGERVLDDTDRYDLVSWYDMAIPVLE